MQPPDLQHLPHLQVNIFQAVSPFETCEQASTSQKGLNIFLTLGNMALNFFHFQPHNIAVHCFFSMRYYLINP